MPAGVIGSSAGNTGSSPRKSRRVKSMLTVAILASVIAPGGVQSIPALLVMREGKVTSRQVGAVPAAALRSWIEQALAG